MEGCASFVHEDHEFFTIALDKYCKKDIEVCAVKKFLWRMMPTFLSINF